MAENLSVAYRSRRTDDVPSPSRALPENLFGVLECCLSYQLPSGIHKASLVALVVKTPPANAGDITDMGSIPGSGRCLEKEDMATCYSILAWRIRWTEEPGGLQSWGGKESDTTKATWQASKQFIKQCPVPCVYE